MKKIGALVFSTFATLVVTECLDLFACLELYLGNEVLELRECVTLLFEEMDFFVSGEVVDEGNPIPEATRRLGLEGTMEIRMDATE